MEAAVTGQFGVSAGGFDEEPDLSTPHAGSSVRSASQPM
jgi:hypothetical protein